MEKVAQIENSDITSRRRSFPFSAAKKSNPKVSVRVSPNGYVSALFLLTFLASLLFYLEREFAGLIILGVSWLFIPILIFTDKISFDGETLRREGWLIRLCGFWNGTPPEIKLSEIEQVESETLRTVRSGGKVYYRYRTEVSGKELSFIFASGGKSYRQMIRSLLPLVPAEKLDLRSLELRDYLVDPQELNSKIKELELPSDEVLEDSLPADVQVKKKREKQHLNLALDTVDRKIRRERAAFLRQTGNELRIAGNLAQAVEAFRRALLLDPQNGWLLYDFARCWFSFAGAEKTEKGLRRAVAALRLASKRGQNDEELQTRIGESFLQFGNLKRAEKTWRNLISAENSNFRAERGLAEVALQNGKIAHAIHHFAAAAFAVADETLKNRLRDEVNYFTRLNNDEMYLEMEMARLSLLEGLFAGRRITFRLALGGILVIACGLFIDESLVSLGWTCASIAVLGWLICALGAKLFTPRTPADIELDDDDD